MIEDSDDLINEQDEPQETITRVTGMYKDWFLDYASYVILERAVPAIEDGFKLLAAGKVDVPPVGFLNFAQPPGDVHIKYGAVQGAEHYVLKVASAFYENPKQGLPASDGMMLVFSQKTGELRRILLDKGWLTDMRTAAAGAVAAKHLAPQRVEQIGIVGTGVQARMQLGLLTEVNPCKRYVIWGRDKQKAEALVAELASNTELKQLNLELNVADSLETLVKFSQLIVTTTSAKAPLIQADWVQPGTHITAMGSDDHGKQELAAELLARADLVVADSRSQCIDHGECAAVINQQLITADDIVELGKIINGTQLGRQNDEQISIVDLTGVAIQDIQIAGLVDQAWTQHEENRQ